MRKTYISICFLFFISNIVFAFNYKENDKIINDICNKIITKWRINRSNELKSIFIKENKSFNNFQNLILEVRTQFHPEKTIYITSPDYSHNKSHCIIILKVENAIKKTKSNLFQIILKKKKEWNVLSFNIINKSNLKLEKSKILSPDLKKYCKFLINEFIKNWKNNEWDKNYYLFSQPNSQSLSYDEIFKYYFAKLKNKGFIKTRYINDIIQISDPKKNFKSYGLFEIANNQKKLIKLMFYFNFGVDKKIGIHSLELIEDAYDSHNDIYQLEKQSSYFKDIISKSHIYKLLENCQTQVNYDQYQILLEYFKNPKSNLELIQTNINLFNDMKAFIDFNLKCLTLFEENANFIVRFIMEKYEKNWITKELIILENIHAKN